MTRKIKAVISYTVEQCDSCTELSKRKFSSGDYIFKIVSKCPSCNGEIRITKIFGETITP
jgi:hypothetical protein